MTLNVQTNVTIPQNQPAFKAQLSPTLRELCERHIKQSGIKPPKFSFLDKVKLYIICERLNHRLINWETYYKAIKAALGLNTDKDFVCINKDVILDDYKKFMQGK